MIKFHKDILRPSDGDVLWHYMSLGSFIWMLQNSELFFTRLDKFNDEYDGVPTRLDLQYFDIGENYCKMDRQRYYAYCWICSETEQHLMWNSYARNREGIAIKTTVRKLMESAINSSYTAYIGKVSYIDVSSSSQTPGEILNVLRHSFSKRNEFSSENEVRLLISSAEHLTEPHAEAYSIKVNLKTLIESIVLHPQSPPYLLSVVRGLINNYGLLDSIVQESSLKIKDNL